MADLLDPVRNESVLPLLQKFYSLEAISKDPWSDDSILFLPNTNQFLIEPGAGAESIASLIYLDLLNVKYTVKFAKNVNEMSPSGRGPLLKCGKYSVGEFEPIVNFCNLKGYRLLSSYLDHTKKNQVKSYIMMIEKAFSDAISFFVWKENPLNHQLIKKSFDENYPWPLNKILYFTEYYHERNRLDSLDLWNTDKTKVLDKYSEVINCLNRKLDGNQYLIDNRLSEADIILYSYLKVINTSSQLNPLLSSLREYPNLDDFYSNLNQQFEKLIHGHLNLKE